MGTPLAGDAWGAAMLAEAAHELPPTWSAAHKQVNMGYGGKHAVMVGTMGQWWETWANGGQHGPMVGKMG